MAEIVDDTVWQVQGRKSVSRYPWETWLDGKTRILHRGEDFTCTAKGMQNATHVYASRMRIRVRTSILDDNRLQLKAER
jgi:hypothetical protein